MTRRSVSATGDFSPASPKNRAPDPSFRATNRCSCPVFLCFGIFRGWPRPCEGLYRAKSVFRAAVLTIVLTLAATPSAALLCRTWCNPHAAAAEGCHQAASTTSTIAAVRDTCEDQGLGAAAFLRANVRRGVSVFQRVHAVAAIRYRLAQTTADERSRQNAWGVWSVKKRPLSTVLRV